MTILQDHIGIEFSEEVPDDVVMAVCVTRANGSAELHGTSGLEAATVRQLEAIASRRKLGTSGSSGAIEVETPEGTVVLVASGSPEPGDLAPDGNERIRQAAAATMRALTPGSTLYCKLDAVRSLDVAATHSVAAWTEGLALAAYRFDKYRGTEEQESETRPRKILFGEARSEDVEAVSSAVEAAAAVGCARDLVNEPANRLGPGEFASVAEALGEEVGLEVDVKQLDEIEALGMHAFLAVSRGSATQPRLVVLRHRGGGNDGPVLGLAGKGITYDSGGYSLKPTRSMKDMKTDMAGAAAVLGAMALIARRNLPVNVTAVVAACENMVSGHAYRPGDIIDSMAGITVEIGNTDAEGRLTLADALTYLVRQERATRLVDVATLTGAAVVALGKRVTAAMANDPQMIEEIRVAATQSGEPVWQLPLVDSYRKQLDSKVAQINNSGGRPAGAITAGLFLQRFVHDRPWLHLDIAGSGRTDTASGYLSPGGTGAMVRTLAAFIANTSS